MSKVESERLPLLCRWTVEEEASEVDGLQCEQALGRSSSSRRDTRVSVCPLQHYLTVYVCMCS